MVFLEDKNIIIPQYHSDVCSTFLRKIIRKNDTNVNPAAEIFYLSDSGVVSTGSLAKI